MDRVVVDDAMPQLFAAGVLGGTDIVGQVHVVGDLADHQGGGDMHIEGQAGGCTVAAEFFGSQCVRDEIAA